MIGEVAGFDDYMQSGFQYVLTILGAAAAVHWMFEGFIRSTWEWIASSKRIQAEGVVAAVFLLGLAAGPALLYNNHMVWASIVMVLALVATVDGSRVLSRNDAVKNRW